MGRPKHHASDQEIEKDPMIRKVTFALFAATAAINLASPAFAQTQDRYGSSLPYYYDSSGSMVWGSWGPKGQSTTGGIQGKASASYAHNTRHARDTRHARGYNALARHHEAPRAGG
jgi:hypothetical protein